MNNITVSMTREQAKLLANYLRFAEVNKIEEVGRDLREACQARGTPNEADLERDRIGRKHANNMFYAAVEVERAIKSKDGVACMAGCILTFDE